MAAPLVQLASLSADDTVIRLPHPYLTAYTVQRAASTSSSSPPGPVLCRLRETANSSGAPPPAALADAAGLAFSKPADLKSSELPPASDNSAWARARRSPSSTVSWDGAEPPPLAQVWLLLYVLFTLRPAMETLRLELAGRGAATLARRLTDVLLA
ncbi:lysine N-acyltransferase, partial [Tolypocladium capitatum]